MLSKKTKTLTQLGLLLALQAVLFLTPLGIITIPPISMTTMHIPVIIAAILLGPKCGAIVGAEFGLMSLVKATFQAASPVDMMFSPVLSGKPIESIILCVVARIALGLVAAYAYKLLKNTKMKKSVQIGLSAAIATICHTLMVLGCLSIFFSAMSLQAVIATMLTLNCGLETVAAVVISIGVVIPLQKANK